MNVNRDSSPYNSPPVDSSVNILSQHQESKETSRKLSCGSDLLDSPLTPHISSSSSPLAASTSWEEINLNSGHEEKNDGLRSGRGLSFDIKNKEMLSSKRASSDGTQGAIPKPFMVAKEHPFKTWMGTVHMIRNQPRPLTVRKDRWPLEESDEDRPANSKAREPRESSGHQKASSWASSGFVTAVKAAAASLGPPSLGPQSQRSETHRLFKTKRSSKQSSSPNQVSGSSSQASTQVMDEAALNRGIHRRKVLEELISSEKSYVDDLKVLDTVCPH